MYSNINQSNRNICYQIKVSCVDISITVLATDRVLGDAKLYESNKMEPSNLM